MHSNLTVVLLSGFRGTIACYYILIGERFIKSYRDAAYKRDLIKDNNCLKCHHINMELLCGLLNIVEGRILKMFACS